MPSYKYGPFVELLREIGLANNLNPMRLLSGAHPLAVAFDGLGFGQMPIPPVILLDGHHPESRTLRENNGVDDYPA